MAEKNQEPEGQEPEESMENSNELLNSLSSAQGLTPIMEAAESVEVEGQASLDVVDTDWENVFDEMEGERYMREQRAQNCGCDSAIGYDSDGEIRHEQVRCAYLAYLKGNDADDSEDFVEEILEENELSLEAEVKA